MRLNLRNRSVCCQVLRQIGNGVAGGLDGAGGPGEAGGGGGVNPGGVVHKVGGESGIIPHVLVAEISGELVDDGRYHLHVAQLLGAYKGVKMEPQTEAACAARDSSLVSGSK